MVKSTHEQLGIGPYLLYRPRTFRCDTLREGRFRWAHGRGGAISGCSTCSHGAGAGIAAKCATLRQCTFSPVKCPPFSVSGAVIAETAIRRSTMTETGMSGRRRAESHKALTDNDLGDFRISKSGQSGHFARGAKHLYPARDPYPDHLTASKADSVRTSLPFRFSRVSHC